VYADQNLPCRLSLGFRSLLLRIINDFMFSSVPDELDPLQSEKFEDPFTLATLHGISWVAWLVRNFPVASRAIFRIPRHWLLKVTSVFDSGFAIADVCCATFIAVSIY
jgi:hypothetical protein